MRLSVGIFAFVLCCATSSVWAIDDESDVDSTPVTESTLMAPLVKCFNCTATQMYNVARARTPGYVFVYDLSHRTIQKYQVTADTSCRPVSGDPGKGGTTTSGCGTSNIATLMSPVDTFVQNAYAQMLVIYDEAPQIVLNPLQQFRIDISKFGHDNTYNDNRNFDPRNVAWDNPQGSYYYFMQSLRNALSSRAATADIDKGLADAVWGMSPYLSSFQIQGSTGTQSATIGFERGWTHAEVQICSASDCVDIVIDKAPNGQVTLNYNGVWDANGHQYPSPALNIPPGPSWNFHDGSSESHFEDYLGTHGTFVTPPANPCQNVILSCARRNSTGYESCRADCG